MDKVFQNEANIRRLGYKTNSYTYGIVDFFNEMILFLSLEVSDFG